MRERAHLQHPPESTEDCGVIPERVRAQIERREPSSSRDTFDELRRARAATRTDMVPREVEGAQVTEAVSKRAGNCTSTVVADCVARQIERREGGCAAQLMATQAKLPIWLADIVRVATWLLATASPRRATFTLSEPMRFLESSKVRKVVFESRACGARRC